MIPVIRSIEIFNKYNAKTEVLGTLVGRVDISEIPLRKLKRIFCANDNDINLYDNYDINEAQFDAINKLLGSPIDYSFDKFDYCLVCATENGYYERHRITGKRKGGYPPPS